MKEILLSQGSNEECDGSNDEADAEEIIAYNPPPTLANFNRNYADDGDLLEEQPSYDQSNGGVRSRGCETHTCQICGKVFKYVKPFRNHLRQQHGMKSNEAPPPPPPKILVEEEASDQSLDASFLPTVKGKNSGEFSCKVCNKEFKYIKPLKSHMKLHNVGGITKSGHKRRNRLANSSPAKSTYVPTSSEKQPPYDSRSPYREEIQFPQHSPAQSNRDSSPDFASTLLNTTLHDEDFVASEPPPKRLRNSRKQKLPSRSPTPEKQPAPSVSKRGRKPAEKKDAPEQLPSLFDGFSEVDINSVLKSKAFSFVGEDSQSQSAQTSRSRSSSIESVELVPEFDIFGGPSIDVLESPVKKTAESGKAFPCGNRGCNLKFNLKANLKRHQREAHNK